MDQSFACVKFEKCLADYTGDKKAVEAAIVKGQIGFGATSGSVILRLTTAPKDFLQHLLDTFEGLTDNQRQKVYLCLKGASADVDTQLTGPSDVQTLISTLKCSGLYNAEFHIQARWYPIRLTSTYNAGGWGTPAHCHITAKVHVGDQDLHLGWYVSKDFFEDDAGNKKTMNGKEVLEELGMRFIQQDLDEYETKLTKAQLLSRKVGKVMACTTSVIIGDSGHYGTTSLRTKALGNPLIPKKVVIEPELETDSRQNRMYRDRTEKDATDLPFVRLFSLDLKRYVYLDVADLQPYQFDAKAMDSLVLPEYKKTILDKLFHAKPEDLFGDVLKDKHGGMIVLANGKTGTGKTLTAEIFAEITQKPLYVMEMSELGVDTNKMEERLQRVFDRVTRWGAILLFDEADVFLAKRGESLERAVIVGIFLRLMDYYKGLLFLTTNRAEVIDPAFKSRITIRINYPDLTASVRKQIWGIMLEKSGIKLEGGLDGVPDMDLNGRQIRNMVRLLKVLHGDKVTPEQVKQTCSFACQDGTGPQEGGPYVRTVDGAGNDVESRNA